jgi:hypothetical protein
MRPGLPDSEQATLRIAQFQELIGPDAVCARL